MKTLLRLVLVTALAVASLASIAGCGLGREVAATVNGEDIFVDEIDTELDAIKTEYPQMFQGVDGEAREMDFQRRILENLVVTELVRQEADEQGIDVSDSDVDDALSELKAGFPDEESFQASLDQVGMTEEDLRGQVRDQLLTQAILDMVSSDIEVEDDDIAAYYDENQSQFVEPAAKRASHILFAIEDKETADRIYQELQDGADFAQAATQYSIDTGTAEQGGDLGWPSTPYVAEFQTALDELEVGELSEPVESVFGWHIIYVAEDREESVPSLEDVTEEIRLILQQQQQADAYQVFVDELMDAAEIEYFVDYGPATATEGMDDSEE